MLRNRSELRDSCLNIASERGAPSSSQLPLPPSCMQRSPRNRCYCILSVGPTPAVDAGPEPEKILTASVGAYPTMTIAAKFRISAIDV